MARSGDAALGGQPGAVLDTLLSAAIAKGQATLTRLSRVAVGRLLDSGSATAIRLFNDGEIAELADVMAAIVGTSELLGRALVRDFQRRAEERNAARESVQSSALLEEVSGPVQPLTPERALDYFLRLVPKLGIDPERFGLDKRRQAFTLAAATDDQVLKVVQGIIADRIEQGEAIRAAPKEIATVLDQAGVSPRNPQYAEMVFRTNTMDAYNQGLQDELADPDVQETFPVWKYAAITDARARPHHAARNGRYYPVSVPFVAVRGDGIEDAANCILPGQLVQGRITVGLKSWYAGHAIEICTRSGHCLRLTVNHPVLTEYGFVAAGKIKQRDYLACYSSNVHPVGMAASEDVENAPTAIEKVFEALRYSGAVRIKPRAVDFHGDGKFIQGNIEIVTANRLKVRGRNADSGEECDQGLLAVSGVQLSSKISRGSGLFYTGRVRHTSTGSMRGGDLAFADDDIGYPGPLEPVCVGPASQLDTCLEKPALQERAADIHFIADLLQRFSRQVTLDEVVDIRDVFYTGHVYDLQSVGGWIVANDIIISNCRCTQIPVDKWEWERLRKQGARLSS